MIRLDDQQIQNNFYLFSHLIREEVFEKEICYPCLEGETFNDPDLCTCDKESDFFIADFKIYEKMLFGQIITEIYYYYDPFTRYIYVLNQKNEILKVFDLDETEKKTYKELNGFDICLEFNINQSIILSFIYYNLKLKNNVFNQEDYSIKKYEILGYDSLFEILNEKLIAFLLNSDEETRIDSFCILYPWIDTFSSLKEIINSYDDIYSSYDKFKELLSRINLG